MFQTLDKKRILKTIFILAILAGVAFVIFGKIYFGNPQFMFLYIYGILVTSLMFFTIFFVHFKYVDPYTIAVKNNHKKEPFVSCLVAVYNDPIIIKRCIDSMLNSTYKNKEIIVINDCSIDNTKETLDSYSSFPEVRIINLEKNMGKKRALAEGIKVAKGKYYVFTDSDSVIGKDSIERIITIFESDEDIGAISGHGRALNANENLFTKIQDSWYETQFSIEKALESIYGAVNCVSGPLAAFRKEAIYNYIPAWANDKFLGKEFKFATDRQLTGYVLGSKYIGEKLKRKYSYTSFVSDVDYPTHDWKVVYSKSAKVWTVVPNTFGKIIKQHVRWKKSFIRNLFFTGTFYWRKPFWPAFKYYAGAAFTIFGPFIALRHLVLLPISGNILSGVYYLIGILFVGFVYALAFKLENPDSNMWIYRPLMSLLSTLILSWLLFYSAITIKKAIWHRG